MTASQRAVKRRSDMRVMEGERDLRGERAHHERGGLDPPGGLMSFCLSFRRATSSSYDEVWRILLNCVR
jgi:hypothetical protein